MKVSNIVIGVALAAVGAGVTYAERNYRDNRAVQAFITHGCVDIGAPSKDHPFAPYVKGGYQCVDSGIILTIPK